MSTELVLDPVVAALAVKGVVWAIPVDDATGFSAGDTITVRADDTEPSGPLAAWWSSEADEPEIIWDTFGCNADQIHGVDAHEDETGNWWRIEWPRDQVVGSATVTAVLPLLRDLGDAPDEGTWLYRSRPNQLLHMLGPYQMVGNADLSDHLALFPEGSWTPGGWALILGEASDET